MALDFITGAKVALIACVGFVTFGASLAPFYIAHALSSRLALDIISTASAGSAGIVVGAFLCHMLPEASASFSDYLAATYPDNERMSDYPFAGLVCASVLALLIATDALVVRRGMSDDDGHSHGGEGGSHNHVTDGLKKFVSAAKERSSPRVQEITSAIAAPSNAASPSLTRSTSNGSAYGSVNVRMSTAPPRHGSSTAAATRIMSAPYDAPSPHKEEPVARETLGLLYTGDDEPHEHDVAHALAGSTPHRAMLLRAYVFFGALSLHGVFDGLSVGSETSPQGFTSTTVAVLGHKIFDGLSLGCALFPADLPLLHRYLLLISSSITTPLGIGIGMAAEASAGAGSVRLVNGIVLSMAAGSFAFISLMELLPSSLSDGRWLFGKLTAFVAGIAGMAVLAAFV